MTRRLHIPAMRRDIKEIVVMPAYVRDDMELTLDQEQAIDALRTMGVDDSGYHFLVNDEGNVMADRMPQRPADALAFHNADSLVVGWLAHRGDDMTARQMVTLSHVLVVLHATFPKARLVHVTEHSRRSANIMEARASLFFNIFRDQYDEEGGDV